MKVAITGLWSLSLTPESMIQGSMALFRQALFRHWQVLTPVAVLGFGIRVGSPKFRVGNGRMADVQVQSRFFYGAGYTVRDQHRITKRRAYSAKSCKHG
jgi:hypothetical protein